MTEIQKLKQKSQSNNLEMSFGAVEIILSRIPSLPISKIINAATRAMTHAVIKYISDIVLLLLM